MKRSEQTCESGLGREAESQYFGTTRCRGSGFARRLRGSSKIERGALDSPLGEAPLYLPGNLVPHRWRTPGGAVCRRTTRRRALESAARLLRPRSTKAGRDITARGVQKRVHDPQRFRHTGTPANFLSWLAHSNQSLELTAPQCLQACRSPSCEWTSVRQV